jgi:hypothetical protein
LRQVLVQCVHNIASRGDNGRIATPTRTVAPARPASGRPSVPTGVPRAAPMVRAARPRRRRRFLLRAVPLLALAAIFPFAISWLHGDHAITAQQVEQSAHDEVLRQVIERSGDYSMTIGPLDCVQLGDGWGNCLADAKSNTHRTDHLMVAVGYKVTPGSGSLSLSVRLP